MIVRKAMSKQPADRYETVSAFIDDIERYQKNLPVRAQPERFAYRVRKFVRRNRVSVVAATVAATRGARGTEHCAVAGASRAARSAARGAHQILHRFDLHASRAEAGRRRRRDCERSADRGEQARRGRARRQPARQERAAGNDRRELSGAQRAGQRGAGAAAGSRQLRRSLGLRRLQGSLGGAAG